MPSARRQWREYLRSLPAALLLILVGQMSATATEASLSEYEVKAGFIYNFAKLVQWPSVPDGTPSLLLLCIYRHSPFGDAINTIAGKNVNGRKLAVRMVDSPDQLKNCQIVFLPQSQAADLHEVLGSVRNGPVLTISDAADLASHGVIINFYPEQEAVRFEINIDAAKRAGLTISSRLLNLARIVHDSGALQ